MDGGNDEVRKTLDEGQGGGGHKRRELRLAARLDGPPLFGGKAERFHGGIEVLQHLLGEGRVIPDHVEALVELVRLRRRELVVQLMIVHRFAPPIHGFPLSRPRRSWPNPRTRSASPPTPRPSSPVAPTSW